MCRDITWARGHGIQLAIQTCDLKLKNSPPTTTQTWLQTSVLFTKTKIIINPCGNVLSTLETEICLTAISRPLRFNKWSQLPRRGRASTCRRRCRRSPTFTSQQGVKTQAETCTTVRNAQNTIRDLRQRTPTHTASDRRSRRCLIRVIRVIRVIFYGERIDQFPWFYFTTVLCCHRYCYYNYYYYYYHHHHHHHHHYDRY